MKIHHTQTTYWLIAILLVLSLLGIAKGCKKDRNPAGPARTQRGLALKLTGDSEIRAKATGITVMAEGLDGHGNRTGDTVEERVSGSIFPLDVPLLLYEPPCRWRITATVDLMREPPRVASGEIDVCQEAGVELTMDTFEEFRVESWAIDAPAEVIAGQEVEVRCEAAINAPDSDRFLPVMTLYEEDGHAVKGPITTTLMLSASFPDPYPSTSLQEYRIFTCTIVDGRSPDQAIAKTVRRVLPTPTPTTTPSSTPTPTTTSTPTPSPCTVINENDSGAGSLRQVLADAPANGCSVVTFAAGLPTITLTSGQLTVPAMTVTIDGTGGTVSGGNTTRVFWVNGGTNVTFQNLTITNGREAQGGGIWNDGGMVTVNGTVSGNSADWNSSGIYNNGGIVTINGTVSGNTAVGDCGGIGNSSGTVTVNGTVSGNTVMDSGSDGGGICNWSGTVTINGTVSGNTASDNGGGICNASAGGTVNIVGSGRVISNAATIGTGGGIYNNGGTLNGANGTTVNSNTPDQCAPVACP